MFCSQCQLALLRLGNATAGTAESIVAAHPYLYKHQCFCIAHHQVDFAEFTTVVGGEQCQALLLQILGCEFLCMIAQGFQFNSLRRLFQQHAILAEPAYRQFPANLAIGIDAYLAAQPIY